MNFLDRLPEFYKTLTPDFSPFIVLQGRIRPKPPRDIHTNEGVCDRIRSAAFAELQAIYGFSWAATIFADAPETLKSDWRGLAMAEEKHLGWLLKRLDELGSTVTERQVSCWLWDSFLMCTTAQEFSKFMAHAEDRGRIAGERFYRDLESNDPTTAMIFKKIAAEEVEHINLALRYFPELPNPFSPRAVSSKSVTS